MNKIPMSAAASALLRALLNRAEVSRDRILLTKFHSIDWQSLTFVGERHEIELRIPGPASDQVLRQLCDGLEDSEFCIPGQTVADIAVRGEPVVAPDGSTTVAIEALTIGD
jgi:hypothetical protein